MKYSTHMKLLGLTALLTLSSLSAQAVVITSDADATISKQDPNKNFGSGGSNDVISVQFLGSDVKKAIFRFDLSSVNKKTATEASLAIHVDNNIPGGFVPSDLNLKLYSIKDGEAGDGPTSSKPGNNSWGENTLTWNNSLPGQSEDVQNIDSGTDMAANATLLEEFNIGSGWSTGETITFTDPDILSEVLLDTNNQMTFMLTFSRDTPLGALDFNADSKESSVDPGPTLTVVPEPSASLLISLGLAATLMLRRRR